METNELKNWIEDEMYDDMENKEVFLSKEEKEKLEKDENENK